MNKEEFRRLAFRPRVVPLEVEGLGRVFIRCPSAGEYDDVLNDKEYKDLSAVAKAARETANILSDSDGNPLYAADDWRELLKLDVKSLLAIHSAGLDHAGLPTDDEEGNPTSTTITSTSGSP